MDELRLGVAEALTKFENYKYEVFPDCVIVEFEGLTYRIYTDRVVIIQTKVLEEECELSAVLECLSDWHDALAYISELLKYRD